MLPLLLRKRGPPAREDAPPPRSAPPSCADSSASACAASEAAVEAALGRPLLPPALPLRLPWPREGRPWWVSRARRPSRPPPWLRRRSPPPALLPPEGSLCCTKSCRELCRWAPAASRGWPRWKSEPREAATNRSSCGHTAQGTRVREGSGPPRDDSGSAILCRHPVQSCAILARAARRAPPQPAQTQAGRRAGHRGRTTWPTLARFFDPRPRATLPFLLSTWPCLLVRA